MADYLIKDTTLTGIADAIRGKTGGTDPIMVSDFAGQIKGISGGGGSVEGVHYVTFMSEDGTTELYKRPVADGDDCADPVERGYISAPTKGDAYYFVGWATEPNGGWDENALKAVTENKTVYAAYAMVFIASGTLSDTVTWELDYFGTMTLSGEGDPGYHSDCKWPDYIDSVKSVVIKEGITKTGSFVFKNHTNLTNVTLPDSLTEFGNSAFNGCTSLTSIVIPAKVTTIYPKALSGCELESVIFEDSDDTWNLSHLGVAQGETTVTNAETNAENFNGTYGSYTWTKT